MKRTSALLVVLLCAMGLWAQAPAASSAPAGSKVGIINIEQAILTTAEGKQAEAKLNARFEPKRAQLEKGNQAIVALQQKLKAGGNTLSASAKSDLTQEISNQQRDLQQSAQDAQSDYNQAQREIVNSIGQKMMPIVTRYAQSNGYGLILDISTPWPQNPVLYAATSANITTAIVKLYDQAHPSAASSGATTPATH